MITAMTAQFRSSLIVRDDGGLPYTLVDPLVYDSAVLNRTIIVPSGFKTDLFSIPPAISNLLQKSERGDQGAVIHDFLYQIAPASVTRAQADAVLREALAVCGVGKARRTLIWLGVRAGGWSPWGAYRRAEQVAHAG